MAVTLKGITEDNFIDAFNLKLKKDQEEFVSHPIRSLAQAYVYRDQCQPFGICEDDRMVGYMMVIYDYDLVILTGSFLPAIKTIPMRLICINPWDLK